MGMDLGKLALKSRTNGLYLHVFVFQGVRLTGLVET